MDKYRFVDEFDFLYYSGNDMEDYLMEQTVLEFTQRCPKTFLKFLEEGGIVVLGNSEFKNILEKYFRKDNNENIAGYYYRDKDGYPIIAIDYSIYTSDNVLAFFLWGSTEIHELAHYIDDLYEFSKTEEFMMYFHKYAPNYDSLSNIVEGYQMENEQEFFAILYSDILNFDIEKLNLSDDLYDYMKNVFKITENIDI